jgi:hypothetical protein
MEHKKKECYVKSMMRTSHSMARRRNEVRKGDIFENMDTKSSSSEEKGHLQEVGEEDRATRSE